MKLLSIAIILYTGYYALNDLIPWWIHNNVWMVFLLWCVPITYQRPPPSTPLLTLAITLTFTGVIGSLHVLQHIGFALALASLVPLSLFWLSTALLWMPAFSWIAAQTLPLKAIFPLQLALVTLALLILFVKRCLFKHGFNEP